MRIIEFVTALAHRCKNRTGAHCAFLVDTDITGIEAIGIASAGAQNTAIVTLLQNRNGRSNGRRIVCTYRPTEMCIGMAWREGITRIDYLENAQFRQILPDTPPFQPATRNLLTVGPYDVTHEVTQSIEGPLDWTNLAWVDNWWAAVRTAYDQHAQSVRSGSRGGQSYKRRGTQPRGLLGWSYKLVDQYLDQSAQEHTQPVALPVELDRGLTGQNAVTAPGGISNYLFMLLAQAMIGAGWSNLRQDENRRRVGFRGHNIGALLVSPNNEILAWGLNFSDLNATFHAETVMVRRYLVRNNLQQLPRGSRIFTTLEPCHMCAGLIATLGQDIKVIYGQADTGITQSALARRVNGCSQRLSRLVFPLSYNVEQLRGYQTAQRLRDMLAQQRTGLVRFLYSEQARDFFRYALTRPAAAMQLIVDARAGHQRYEQTRGPGRRSVQGLRPEQSSSRLVALLDLDTSRRTAPSSERIQGLDLAEPRRMVELSTNANALLDILVNGLRLLNALRTAQVISMPQDLDLRVPNPTPALTFR